MEVKYEHVTEQFGASFDTDYKVITQCTPNCPACAYKAGQQSREITLNLQESFNVGKKEGMKEGIKEVVEWMKKHRVHQQRDCEVFSFLPCEIDVFMKDNGL